MLKILILSFYYEPDLCAGSFRTTSLIKQLSKQDNVEIEVLTTMPNRYASFEETAQMHEVRDNISISRFDLPNHASGMIDQIESFSVFYKQVMSHVSGNHYDAVYATSSRLFTAYLGSVVAKKKNIPLYLDIRDIFVDTLNDVLNPVLFNILKPVLRFIEKKTFNSATHINLVSEGFKEYFSKRFKCLSYSYYTNGIDELFINELPESKSLGVKKTVLYAGNLGEGQGLHKIIPALATKNPDYHFVVVGDGGRKYNFIEASKGINNIKLVPPVNRNELLAHYMSADILFLHLNDYAAFEKVLPSKVFEYAATGKPILAGVAGYAQQFIQTEVNNAQVFYPCDSNAGSSALKALDNDTETSRTDFIAKFKRTNIMNDMANSIVRTFSK
jgi:glycosyltransferase involved in cell wall biosynthesis